MDNYWIMSQMANKETYHSIPHRVLENLHNVVEKSLMVLSQVPNIGRGNLLLWGASAGLAGLAIAGSACAVPDRLVDVRLPIPTGRLNAAAAGLETPTPMAPIIHPIERIQQYLNNYIQIDLGSREVKFDKQISPIAGFAPVRIKISEPEGVWVRDFPDKYLGYKVRTGQMEPYYEALQKDADLGFCDRFVVVIDPNSKMRSIWVVRPGEQGAEQGFEFSQIWGTDTGSLVTLTQVSVDEEGNQQTVELKAEDYFANVIQDDSPSNPKVPGLK